MAWGVNWLERIANYFFLSSDRYSGWTLVLKSHFSAGMDTSATKNER